MEWPTLNRSLVKRLRWASALVPPDPEIVTRPQAFRWRRPGTVIETLNLYKQGSTPEEIATKRNLNIVTIYSHLVTLFEKKHEVDIEQYITQAEKQKLFEYLNTNPFSEAKVIHEYFNKTVPYQSIRIAIALFQSEN